MQAPSSLSSSVIENPATIGVLSGPHQNSNHDIILSNDLFEFEHV